MNRNIPETLTIPLAKLEESENIEMASINDDGLAYLIEYGLRQSLNDSMASAKTRAEMIASVAKRLEAIRNGTVASRSGDPLAREIRLILEAKFGAKWRELDAKARNAKIAAVKAAESDAASAILSEAKARLTGTKEIEVEGLDDL